MPQSLSVVVGASAKILPYNFLAEKIVLSCLLINYEAVEITIKTLRVETFYFLNHHDYQTYFLE